MGWIAVTRRFQEFTSNLHYTDTQESQGSKHALGVLKALNVHYFNSQSETNNGLLVGSWAKSTKIRPPGDIDLYFELPVSVFSRYQLRSGNKQSALLQEVKNVLANSFSQTEIKGDGPVVAVNFVNQNIELIPVFKLKTGQYWLSDTKNGGSYLTADPIAEAIYIDNVNRACNNNLLPLIMMMKCWKRYCNVPIKSFSIELIAAEFLSTYQYRMQSYFFYDWMIRDFFIYLYSKLDKYVIVPGTGEFIFLGNNWRSRVETAYARAAKACDYERNNMIIHAGEQWQLIFGDQIPIGATWRINHNSLLMNV